MFEIYGRNVNHLFPKALAYIREEGIEVSPRGMKTLEYPEPVCSTYYKPYECVMFNPKRDANPFFHLMEALWILGGRNDVKFVSQFNSGIHRYSDDGVTYHGAYGHRLRSCGQDQLSLAIHKLKEDPDTRQVVLQIWNKDRDLCSESRDIPCNDLIMCKIRDNRLNISVCNRSNDAIWGCYGANTVQFAFIQEYLASKIGCEIGTYRQVSDSLHVYVDNPQWEKCKNLNFEDLVDPYSKNDVEHYPLVVRPATWDLENVQFLNGFTKTKWDNPFFPEVAIPMRDAFLRHKESKDGAFHLTQCMASDWRLAGLEWLQRRGDEL